MAIRIWHFPLRIDADVVVIRVQVFIVPVSIELDRDTIRYTVIAETAADVYRLSGDNKRKPIGAYAPYASDDAEGERCLEPLNKVLGLPVVRRTIMKRLCRIQTQDIPYDGRVSVKYKRRRA
jgi:hypothetical protein